MVRQRRMTRFLTREKVMTQRYTSLTIALLSGALPLVIAADHAGGAEAYPSKPVRIIVPTGAGGSTDTLARISAQKLSAGIGQQFVVENRTGAGGVIGTDVVAKAAPDGYTLLMAFGSHVINPTLYPKLPYDTIKDFAPITQVAVQPLLVTVHPALPARNMKELIALAKRRPGELNYSSSGAGSGGHLATEIMLMMAEVKMTHVPYKASAMALFEVVAGNIDLTVLTLITSLPQVRAGKVRALGITSSKRSSILPDVPAVGETIPGYDVEVSYFLVAPAKTPREIIQRLNTEMVKLLKQPDVVERLATDGAVPVANSPEETTKVIESEIPKWGKAVKASGAKEN
jgi:tripartite-type tricarboxylate transporter receptor subunit TctC